MSSVATTFADLLRHLRISAALSQEDLAGRAGLSLRGISDLERGVRRSPHLSTVRLLADALELNSADRQALYAAARPQDLADSNIGSALGHPPLPVPLTSLIGRAQELSELKALLGHTDARLVTLNGPGGSGKTRLAVEVGAQLQAEFGDGVAFVDLSPLRDAQFVLPTIAGTLGVRERLGQSLLQTLSGFLAPKHLLLLLDNCEQVLEGAPEIAALLESCPRLSVLATSRAVMRVRGERVFPLLPLPLPSVEKPSAFDALAQVPTVALFLERARANQPSIALTPGNAAAIASICRRLDGLPLAIELAAAWVRILPPAALLDRLERRLLLLTGGSRDLPARQRTMRDAIAWSYDLLAESEQTLFRCLAVFAGGWTLEAAEVVSCGTDRLDVVAGLEALVAASLVQAVEQPGGDQRFRMLETVREFGLERLVSHGELDEVSHRHAHYFVTLAQSGGADLTAAVLGAWFARLLAEQADLRAALAWLQDHEESADGVRLAAALGGFWRTRSASAEGRAWLESFLAQPSADAAPVVDRIAALRWAGELAGLEGDLVTAETRLSESLKLARSAGDKRGTAAALGALGSVLFQHVDIARSVEPLQEAAALMRELGDLRQAAFLSAYLGGAVGIGGDLAQGEALVSESENMLQSLGDTGSFEANFVVMIQGWLALRRGDFDRARERLEAALDLARVLDAKGTLSATHAFIAELALIKGETATAADHYRDGLILGWEGDFAIGMVYNLQGLISLGSQNGAYVLIARLVGAVDALGGAVQQVMGLVPATHLADAARARTALGEEAFTTARVVGRVRPLEQTIAEAVALADEVKGEE